MSTVGRIASADLDAFIEESDQRGGVGAADFEAWSADFSIDLTTPIDESIDPFSSDYVDTQIAVYGELSGRAIDQEANELSTIDVPALVPMANPYGSQDVPFIARHARSILSSILVSDLPTAARVLDMGCGWGLSTEMFAFSGCLVDAVDINAQFAELVQQRALGRGYGVSTQNAAFDSFETDHEYDLAFFYESLHHAIEPWTVLERVARHVKPGGKITIAGEPIQELWWRHWGLRLDAVSVYCIRKYGWFESGWSDSFIRDCFARVGFELTLFPGVGINHTPIGVAVRPGDDVPTPSDHEVVSPEVRALRHAYDDLAAKHHELATTHAAAVEAHDALLARVNATTATPEGRRRSWRRR